MTECLKNNPITLRHCLLYVFLQKKSVEKAFDDFCETVGNDVIKEEEFQFWFDQFEQGKFDDKEQPLADIKEVIRNEKQALRACVMYEWLTTKNMKLVNGALSPFTKYINFCKVIGDDVMGYRKFDIWFYRFENGMFDLKFEMDKDEKILELSDMPVDVMKNVVEYLDTFDRVSLAKTSRTFKTFVEDQKSSSKKLIFKLSSRTAWIYFENRKVVITKSGDTFYRSSENEHSQNKRLIKGVSPWKQGIQELVSILKYPKLHLEEFSFSLHIPDYFNKPTEGELEELDKSTQVLETAFKSLQQLHVKKLWLYTFNMNPLLNILPTLKPGYLSTIEIRIQKLEGDKMKEVVELEQWKQAKYFAMNWAESGTDFDVGSLSHFYHFKKFVVILNRFSVDDIREMKKILFNSPGFEYCTIQVKHGFDENAIRNEFGDSVQGTPSIYHYPIPNAEDYFEIEIRGSIRYGVISITRKQK
ncbi:unnamed protein product [Caenorhabditis brenneri]